MHKWEDTQTNSSHVLLGRGAIVLFEGDRESWFSLEVVELQVSLDALLWPGHLVNCHQPPPQHLETQTETEGWRVG